MGEATTVHEDSQERLSLLELLDRVLNKGVVLSGDLVISVADVDLIYLQLRVLLTSVETGLELGALAKPPERIQPETGVKHDRG